MAIYRSDQASVTFAAEAAQGGHPESASIGSSGDSIDTNAAAVAGDRSLSFGSAFTVTSGANGKVMATIGEDTLINGPKEVRRVIGGYGTTTIQLDAPLAFNHPSGTAVVKKILVTGADSNLTNADSGKYITWFPGVYENVDCPDPEQAFEPRYVLGGLTNRNFYQMYAGNETLTGSIGGMVMLNGFPLRFAVGKVVSVPVVNPSSASRKLAVATAKGDLYISLSATGSQALAVGDYILFGNSTSTAPFDAFYTSGSVRPSDVSTTPDVNYEIRQVETVVAASTAVSNIKLNMPLQFAHKVADYIFKLATPDATTYYKHSIIEQVALPSLTWNVNILDDTGANPWQRRYIGGKVGSMTLSAEAGGLLTGGWEGVNFLDMLTNMQSHPDIVGGIMPRFAEMQNITSANVGRPTVTSAGVDTFVRPATEPYYYSQGIIKLFSNEASVNGVEVARIASVNLSISNNTEPKYYVGAQYDGRRAAKEQFEGNREYSMTASIGVPDAADQNTDNQRSLFKELLLAGDYRGASTSTYSVTQGFRGFGINLKFIRDIDGDQNDYIEIIIPEDGTAAPGGNEQGAFIRTAAHNIGEDSPITADADIVFRNLVINVQDHEPIYP